MTLSFPDVGGSATGVLITVKQYDPESPATPECRVRCLTKAAAQERGKVRGANERTASNPEAVGTEDIGHPTLDLSGRVTGRSTSSKLDAVEDHP
jgi:hypothetical protein